MVRLILNNVLRHRLLYSLIGLVVALLSFYMVVGLNAAASVSESLERAIAENMSGDLVIAAPEAGAIDLIARSGERGLVPLRGWKELLAFVRGREYVAAASPRLRVPAVLRSVDNAIPVVLTGVDPGSEPGLLPGRKLDEGDWISGGGEINLYYRHADALSASVGDELGVTVTTAQGYPRFALVGLAGNFDYRDTEYYSELAYHGFVDLSWLNEILMNPAPLASEIHVRLGPGGSPSRLERDIRAGLGAEFRYIPPRDSSRLVAGIFRLARLIIFLVMAILFAMVYLCSSFIVNLSVESRSKEIGIYQALGVKSWKIGMLFSGEFLVVMIAFAAAGSAVAAVAMRRLSETGINATIVPLHLVFGRSVLHVTDMPASYLIAFAAILVAFAGNAIAAMARMGRLKPAEIGREL